MQLNMSLNAFLDLPVAEKVPLVEDYAVLYAQQYNRADLDYFCKLADGARMLHKRAEGADLMASLLRHRLALNFFVQPSSRTFLSFSAAQSMLGMKRMSVRDINISSMSKGESLVDSVRTFISYVDLVVQRHGDEFAGAVAYWVSVNSGRRLRIAGEERPVPIISAGSGTKQHPTQALLDIYTLEKSFERIGGIDGKTIMLVGDLKRGRTVRSLCLLMKNYQGVNLLLAAPEKYQMGEDILAILDAHGVKYSKINSLDEGLPHADAVYMTRIQDEWDNLAPGTHTKAGESFIFRFEHLDRMKRTACLLHPLPKRDEIEEAVDYCGDRRVVYWRQERNGMWMRVAIIARLFRVDGQIMAAAHG
jgi:aspartate carbamoyltransferase catalytic subunit